MSRVSRGALATLNHTWRALAAPRRALPIALVLGAMAAAEWWATRSLAALAVDLALFAGFVVVLPSAWRLLASGRAGALGLAGYLAVGIALVAALGLALPAALGLARTYVVDGSSIGVVLALVLVGGWGLGRDVELEAGLESERARAERLALESERAQLLALRAQLDPHFLFNTLNAIAEWCREDPEVAESATLRLASMLRSILDGIRAPVWPLASELALARGLFELFAIRDPEQYHLELDAPEALPEDAQVPPMLFLPLLENAITHGPSKGHAGAVRASLRADDAGIVLTIENPGAFAGRREGGEGLALVERRLALAYGARALRSGRAGLSIGAEGEGTRTELRVPLRPLASEAAA